MSKNNKLFNLLRYLGRKQVTDFERYFFARFDEKDQIRQVYQFIQPFYPNYDDPTLHDNAAIEQALFQQPSEKNLRLLNLFADIFREIRHFLSAHEMRKDGFESKVLWLRALKEIGWEAEQDNLIEQLNKEPSKEPSEKLKKESSKKPSKEPSRKTSKEPKINLEYYQQKLLSRQIQYTHTANSPLESEDESLDHYMEVLDQYYLLSKLKLACEMATMNQVFGRGYDLNALKAQIAGLPMGPDSATYFENHPLIHLYVELFKLSCEPTDDQYERVSALYKKSISKIEAVELHKIHSYLLNYCTQRIRFQKNDFLEKGYALNKLSFEFNVFARYGAMSPTLFNNIVGVACSRKDFLWAEKFIQEQSPYLNSDDRKDTELIAKVTLALEQNQFEEVLKMLKKLKKKQFQDLHHNLRANVFKLIALYHIPNIETEDVERHLSNFSLFLHRKKAKLGKTAEGFKNFNRIFKLLIKRSDSQESILIEFKNQRPIVGQQWLEQMIQTYKKL